jgi:ubiquinone/menaquinone biosynthesis C-methylase UbiE
MDKLLPDELRDLWQSVTEKRLTHQEFERAQACLTEEYKMRWSNALILEPHTDLKASLISEIGLYFKRNDLAEIEREAERGVFAVREEWQQKVAAADTTSVEQFYDQSTAYIYDLMWWHALGDDLSPLAYVVALHFAEKQGCRSHLDFGAGVGAGSILFARNEIGTSLADISSTLLAFSRWRLETRRISAGFFDLKTDGLPDDTFDFVTAMDVFEHLLDPVSTVELLWRTLKPGGFLFVRLHEDVDVKRPQHVVQDFKPTRSRLRELGLVEVWYDEWLWGHQIFQKT